jgi:hypothetical protein
MMQTQEQITAVRQKRKLWEYGLLGLGTIPLTFLISPIGACFFVQSGLLIGSQVQIKTEREEDAQRHMEALAALMHDFETRGVRPADESLIQNFLGAKGRSTKGFYVGVLAERLLFSGLIAVCLAFVEQFYDVGFFPVTASFIWLLAAMNLALAFLTWLPSLFIHEEESQ